MLERYKPKTVCRIHCEKRLIRKKGGMGIHLIPIGIFSIFICLWYGKKTKTYIHTYSIRNHNCQIKSNKGKEKQNAKKQKRGGKGGMSITE